MDGGVHDDVEDTGGENRNALFLLRHTQGHRQGEYQSQVAENGVAGVVEQQEDAIENRSGVQDAGEAVGRDGGGIGERVSDAQQNARKGQDGNGQEQGFAQLLEYGKRAAALFFFHGTSS